MIAYFDSHCHYHHIDSDFASVGGKVADWRSLLSSELKAACLCGTSPEDWTDVLSAAKDSKAPQYLPFLGIHPWQQCAARSGALEQLNELLTSNASCHVGEIGLDKSVAKREDNWEWQVVTFQKQWQLACEHDRVINIHCVKAWQPLLELIKSLPTSRGFILHAFTAPVQMVNPFFELGAYFSFSLTTLQRLKVRNLLNDMPLERLLIETDAPYMPPNSETHLPTLETAEGQAANHPKILEFAYEQVAISLELSLDATCDQIWQNARTLLAI